MTANTQYNSSFPEKNKNKARFYRRSFISKELQNKTTMLDIFDGVLLAVFASLDRTSGIRKVLCVVVPELWPSTALQARPRCTTTQM